MEKPNLLLTEGPSLLHCTFSKKEIKNKKKTSAIECQYSMGISVLKENNNILAFLSVKSDSEEIPFDFDVRASAVFSVKGMELKIVSKETTETKLIPIAIPYIFSFLREMVADLTRKATLNPFYLPSIEFDVNSLDKLED